MYLPKTEWGISFRGHLNKLSNICMFDEIGNENYYFNKNKWSFDMREYFDIISCFGNDRNFECQNGFRFWSLHSLKNLSNDKHITIFCDYLQESWWYGVDNETDNIFIIHSETDTPFMVSSSISKFINLYIEDSKELYLPSE